MAYEDLRSRTAILFVEHDKIKNIQEVLESTLKREVAISMKHIATISRKQK